MDTKPQKQSFLFYRICFFIQGFCGAIPWFTILSTLDFYITKYPAYNVAQSIIIPNFIGQGIFAILIYFLSFYLTLNVRMKHSLFSIISILTLLLLIPLVSSQQSLYWILLILVFFLGSFNTVFQTSSTALCYVFPLEYTPLFFLGNSFAGLFTVGLRMILMKTMENSENPLIYSTIGFIITAIVIIIIAILLYEKLITTQLYFTCLYREFKQSLAQSILGSQLNDFKSFRQVEMDENAKMQKYKNLMSSILSVDSVNEEDKVNKNDESLLGNQKNFEIEINQPTQSINFSRKDSYPINFQSMDIQIKNVNIQNDMMNCSTNSVRKNNKNKLNWGYFFPILKKISPMMFLILLLFAQSLFVFPGMVIKKRLFGLDASWNSLLWILLFNSSDSVAKILTLWPLRLRINTFRILVLLRFLFWASFILIKNSEQDDFVNNDWFCILHLIAFSVIGGILTNALMIAALESGRTHEKETIGMLISIPSIYGMMMGSFLALGSKYI